jgi:carbon monoxide dehydrogenase subunit G
MLIEDVIVVRAPADDVWRFLLDLPAVAGCLPGARFDEMIDDRTYEGGLRMKVGPIAMEYRGRVVIEEVDEQARQATLVAAARDESGGTASARMQLNVGAAGEDTRVELSVDVALTGRAAQFGRNIVEDVTRVMIGRFAAEVGHRLSGNGVPSTAVAAAQGPERAAESGAPASSSALPAPESLRAAVVARPLAGPPPAPGRTLYSEPREVAVPAGSAGGELDLGSLALTILRARLRALRKAAVSRLKRARR